MSRLKRNVEKSLTVYLSVLLTEEGVVVSGLWMVGRGTTRLRVSLQSRVR